MKMLLAYAAICGILIYGSSQAYQIVHQPGYSGDSESANDAMDAGNDFYREIREQQIEEINETIDSIEIREPHWSEYTRLGK